MLGRMTDRCESHQSVKISVGCYTIQVTAFIRHRVLQPVLTDCTASASHRGDVATGVVALVITWEPRGEHVWTMNMFWLVAVLDQGCRCGLCFIAGSGAVCWPLVASLRWQSVLTTFTVRCTGWIRLRCGRGLLATRPTSVVSSRRNGRCSIRSASVGAWGRRRGAWITSSWRETIRVCSWPVETPRRPSLGACGIARLCEGAGCICSSCTRRLISSRLAVWSVRSCWPLRTVARLPSDRGSVWYLCRPFFDCKIVGRRGAPRDSSAKSSGAEKPRDIF